MLGWPFCCSSGISLRSQDPIPVCRPLLPSAATLLPYLEEIDGARWYSNYGPLYHRFRSALASTRSVEADQLTIVASGTIGLTLALQAQGAVEGLCMVPGWTFIATPMAARAAGLRPWFVDIDPESWSLTPEMAMRYLATAPEPIAAILPVAPFGAPAPLDEWDRFAEETGIPVVIDAAAGFDALKVGRVPTIVSFHATKALGIGEGGAIFSRDTELIRRAQQLANLGLQSGRTAAVTGMNAKLSEYGCAVGLAALDQWPAHRAALKTRAMHYRARLSDLVEFQPGFGDAATATCVIGMAGSGAVAMKRDLAALGIETLRWWHAVCLDHPAFADALGIEIPVARRAAAQTLGLPMGVTLALGDIDRVAEAVRSHLSVLVS